MDRCPVCRARCRDEPVCRRCRTDLLALQRIEAQADRLVRLAVREIAANDYQQARRSISQASFLHAHPFVRHLACFLKHLESS